MEEDCEEVFCNKCVEKHNLTCNKICEQIFCKKHLDKHDCADHVEEPDEDDEDTEDKTAYDDIQDNEKYLKKQIVYSKNKHRASIKQEPLTMRGTLNAIEMLEKEGYKEESRNDDWVHMKLTEEAMMKQGA